MNNSDVTIFVPATLIDFDPIKWCNERGYNPAIICINDDGGTELECWPCSWDYFGYDENGNVLKFENRHLAKYDRRTLPKELW
jgi:hypothetical protein